MHADMQLRPSLCLRTFLSCCFLSTDFKDFTDFSAAFFVNGLFCLAFFVYGLSGLYGLFCCCFLYVYGLSALLFLSTDFKDFTDFSAAFFVNGLSALLFFCLRTFRTFRTLHVLFIFKVLIVLKVCRQKTTRRALHLYIKKFYGLLGLSGLFMC